MLLWQEKDPVPEKYRLWPHEQGIVLMMKSDLIETADVPLWQTSTERINQWHNAIGSGGISISKWEGIKNPMLSWGFGGVGSLGGLQPADDPKNEWTPFFFPYYPANDRAGRERALNTSVTLAYTLYQLNNLKYDAKEGNSNSQLMLIRALTNPQNYNLWLDVSAGFRRWMISSGDVELIRTVERLATEAHNFLLPKSPTDHALTFCLMDTCFRIQAERFALNTTCNAGEDQGIVVDSVEVDTPVQQLVLLRALAAFWAIYYQKK